MITLDDAKKEFQNAFNKYDIVKELFPELNHFIHKYAVLSSQLKDGDSLEIKVETIENEKSGDRNPVIFVNLNIKGVEESTNVMLYNTNGSYSNPVNMDLYDNVRN